MSSEVPAGWSTATIGDILSESQARCGDRTDLPALSLTKHDGLVLASDRFDRQLHGKDISRYRVVRTGDVVLDPMLLWDGAIARSWRFVEGFVSPDYRVFRLLDSVDPSFVEQVLGGEHMQQAFRNNARGTNKRRNRIARRDFLAISFPCPPLAEQTKIAAVLSAVDAAIETTRAVIEQTEQMRAGLLQALLSFGIEHKRMRDSAVGRIPIDWEVSSLGQFLPKGSVQNGLYRPASDYGEEGFPIVRIDSFQHGEVADLGDLRRVQLEAREAERYAIEEDDLVINRVNSLTHLAKCAIMPAPTEATVYESNMMRLRLPKDIGLEPRFLHAVLALPYAWNHFQVRAKKAIAQASINQGDVRALAVPVPPIDEQREIAARLADARVVSSEQKRSLAQLEHLKAGLLQDLLTGAVRVTP